MPRPSEAALRRLIGRVGALSRADLAAVLGALTHAQRLKVERLLAASRSAAAQPGDRAGPALAPFLKERLADEGKLMTPRAGAALRDNAARLFGAPSGEADSLFDRVAKALLK